MPAAPLHGRLEPAAVWTGHQMILWGGYRPGSPRETIFPDGAVCTPR